MLVADERVYRFLVVSVTAGCDPTNLLWFCDLEGLPKDQDTGAIDFPSFDRSRNVHKPLPLIKFVDTFEASFQYVANEVRDGLSLLTQRGVCRRPL